MKKVKFKSENSKVDVYNTYSEDNLEFVSRKDEEETLQSLGIYNRTSKRCYNEDFNNYFD